MADISKIKINEQEALNIKDAQGRANMTTLLGGHTLAGLGDAAWKGVATAVSATSSNDDLATAKAVYDAIQAIGKALHFVGVATKQEGETEAQAVARTFPIAEQTEGAIAVCGTKEFIAYGTPLAWNEFGDEGIYLTKAEAEANYVKKILTIAGIDLADNITAAELQSALGLGNMAYADQASGSITTADSINSITVAKAGEYTVAGTAVAVPASYSALDVTPAGSVELTAGTAAAATYQKANSATISAAASDTGNYTPAGSVSLPTYTSAVTPSKEAVATVTNAGIAYTLSDGSVTQGEDSTSTFAKTGMLAALDNEDAEMLVFTNAQTANAVTASGEISYTKQTISGSLPTFGTKEVMVGATVATTADGDASFAGTKVQIGAELGYETANATVTQPTFTAEFSGTTKSVTPAVATTVNAAPSNAKITVATETVTPTLVTSTKTVTVNPVAKA